ncbi:hypothetical protein KJ855_03775 [Patescibacteria group bacterium]|nr:hypothetical protein [Patescibacteria group bacterium]
MMMKNTLENKVFEQPKSNESLEFPNENNPVNEPKKEKTSMINRLKRWIAGEKRVENVKTEDADQLKVNEVISKSVNVYAEKKTQGSWLNKVLNNSFMESSPGLQNAVKRGVSWLEKAKLSVNKVLNGESGRSAYTADELLSMVDAKFTGKKNSVSSRLDTKIAENGSNYSTEELAAYLSMVDEAKVVGNTMDMKKLGKVRQSLLSQLQKRFNLLPLVVSRCFLRGKV